jgi:hypothetical protein
MSDTTCEIADAFDHDIRADGPAGHAGKKATCQGILHEGL